MIEDDYDPDRPFNWLFHIKRALLFALALAAVTFVAFVIVGLQAALK